MSTVNPERLERICDACGGPNVVWFAPNALWNQVNGSPDGFLCPTCFIRKADASGLRAVWSLTLGSVPA